MALAPPTREIGSRLNRLVRATLIPGRLELARSLERIVPHGLRSHFDGLDRYQLRRYAHFVRKVLPEQLRLHHRQLLRLRRKILSYRAGVGVLEGAGFYKDRREVDMEWQMSR